MLLLLLHTWCPLGAGASAHVYDRLIGALRVVGLQPGDSDALAGADGALTLLDDLHLPGALEQEHPVHTHPSGLTHLAQAAGGQLVQGLGDLRGCRTAASCLWRRRGLNIQLRSGMLKHVPALYNV